jgi:hypothetical protein
MMQIREQGWECPKCQRIWAPKIAACGACNHQSPDSQASDLIPRYIPTYCRRDFAPMWTADGHDWNKMVGGN